MTASMTAFKMVGKVTPAMASAAVNAAEAVAAKSPKSVLSIPASVRHGPIPLNEQTTESQDKPGAVIRELGGCRRIFVLNPTFTKTEMKGLAYRIQRLGRNSGLNSILVSNALEKEEEDSVLPTMLCDIDRTFNPFDMDDEDYSPGKGNIHHVSNGCDAQALASLNRHERKLTYDALSNLALSIMGSKDADSPYNSKLPVITVPHGLLSDGGYLLAMGSYALATSQSRFEIQNPTRGLALDPIGLSYILPRCGQEYNQPSRNFPVGKILALTGYQADHSDLVETGLFTHSLGSLGGLGLLEWTLSQSLPYNQQNLVEEPTKLYGGEKGGVSQSSLGRWNRRSHQPEDVNAHLRNVAVANIINGVSEFDAAGQEPTGTPPEMDLWDEEDPSLVLQGEQMRVCGDRESHLVNIAATFQDVMEEETAVEGVLERMREFSSMEVEGKDEEEVEFVNVATRLVEGMESRSPLSLSVVWELLKAGKGDGETLKSCMEREQSSQLNLLEHDDYKRWIESGLDEGVFKNWTHSTLRDVTSDEIKEILG